jgi:two-component system NtrC family response regulator
VHELEVENRRLRTHSPAVFEGVIGSSTPMLNAYRMVEKVSPSNATVLLLGETGTGKELFARAIHRLSSRHGGPFVAINCAAIPDALLEAELFGYEKGAYTGAHKQTKGKIELAINGSLLLDEIGDMPLTLQAKLLRFFEERVVERIGGRTLIPVDVRIICATHQDLPALIREGRFREDLFYRISEVSIRLPPLRERAGDPRAAFSGTSCHSSRTCSSRIYRQGSQGDRGMSVARQRARVGKHRQQRRHHGGCKADWA